MGTTHIERAPLSVHGRLRHFAMSEFAFEVNIVAVVRVHAADKNVAREAVSTVLGAPAVAEIRLANENNAASGHHATISNVDFSAEEGSIKLIETDGVPAPAPAVRPPRRRASHK
jgi:hypothetical protein